MDEIMSGVHDQEIVSLSQENALVAAARQDPQAFAGLYDLYAQRVYRYLLSRTGSVQEAEDLTAQTFLAAIQAFPAYRHRGNFSAWLFTIARRKAIDFFRKHKETVSLEGIEEQIPTDGGREPGSKSDRQLDLLTQIQKLSPQEQELLRLRFVAELRFNQIAVLLGKTEAAVKKSTYRLLARLEDQLEGKDA
jgi:RNA polymerase sigma-70 factor (ECF subfamily)